MGGGGSSSSKPTFFPGQKELIESLGLFEPGGFFANILGGAPNIGQQIGTNNALTNVSRQFAQRGLTGSGLEARALSDVAKDAAVGSEADMFNRILASIQPAGTTSINKSGGIFGIG